jgi:ubiquinol-cytochrome c reductase cytochrome c subunit
MAIKRNKNNSRRSPYAAILVILAGLLVSGGGYAAANAVVNAKTETTYSAADIKTGNQLFLANCASCHGRNAEGTKNAPSLIGVGAASVDFQVSTGRMPGAASGPQLPTKTVQFTEEQIKQLAAYVASLAPGPAVPTSNLDPTAGNSTRGGELFRINCAMCHNAVGAGGALTEGKWAASLRDASPKEIYEAMLTGPQNMPVFNDMNLTPSDKKDIVAYLEYLKENPSPGGLELGSLGPVSEGLFIWIFGLGAIIGLTIWITAKSN